MFVITQDLSRMKLEANIDEADIGQVKVDQQAFLALMRFLILSSREELCWYELTRVFNRTS